MVYFQYLSFALLCSSDFFLFYTLPFITQKHAYLENLYGLYKSNSFKRNQGRKDRLSLLKTEHCGRRAFSKHCDHLHSFFRFFLPCQLFHGGEAVHGTPALTQVWTACFVTCRVVTQWCFSTEVQYVENPGCDQYGFKKKKAEREQMKNYNLYICFLHFALTFKFRKYIFTQEQTFQFLCWSQH